MRQIARTEYFSRHVRHFLPYVTLPKVANLVRNVLELRLRSLRPRSTPPYVKIEPTPLCQLACPGCPHGKSDFKRQIVHDKHLTLEEFRRIVDPLAGNLLGLSLSLRGEPLLARHLVPLIRYAHERNIAVSFPTNLSLEMGSEELEALVASGLDAMFVALDGASPETYGRYRVGGRFDVVVDNVRKLAETKRRLRRGRPRLVWKFVVFDHNAHEMSQARATYRGLGFDAFELVDNRESAEVQEARAAHNSRLTSRRRGCYWAWHTMVVRTDGEVLPCCMPHAPFALGSVRERDVLAVWRGDRYLTPTAVAGVLTSSHVSALPTQRSEETRLNSSHEIPSRMPSSA